MLIRLVQIAVREICHVPDNKDLQTVIDQTLIQHIRIGLISDKHQSVFFYPGLLNHSRSAGIPFSSMVAHEVADPRSSVTLTLYALYARWNGTLYVTTPPDVVVDMLYWKKISWVIMMTSSNGNIFRVTGPLCGEFTGPGEFPTQRPVTRSFRVFFDLRLNKRLNKQSRGCWFETLSHPLWRHRNVSCVHGECFHVQYLLRKTHIFYTLFRSCYGTRSWCMYMVYPYSSGLLHSYLLHAPELVDM